MPPARCGSSVTATVTGTLTLYQVDVQVQAQDPPDPENILSPEGMVTGGITLGSGPEVRYDWDSEAIGGGSGGPPWYSTATLDIIAKAKAASGREYVEDHDQVAEVIITSDEQDPGEDDWTVYSEDITSPWSANAELAVGPLYLYKQRGYGIQLETNEEQAAPTHPNHGWVAYAYGTYVQDEPENEDTYSLSADAGVGSATDEQTGETLQVSIPLDENGVPVGGGGGTVDVLDTITVWLSITNPTNTAISGVVARWTNLAYTDGSGSYALDLSSYSYSGNGITGTGGVGTLELAVTDYSLIGSGTRSVSKSLETPVIVHYDLECFDWDTTYSGAQVSIPDGYGSTTAVTMPYDATVTYTGDSLASPALTRPFVVSVRLDSDWAGTAGELVDPPDLACTIEERGLSGATGDWTFDAFAFRRDPEVSLQCPADAEGVLPSAWVSDDSLLLSVTQNGTDTECNVKPSASANYIERTLIGTHANSKTTKHETGYDVRCVENYSHLRLDFTSQEPQTLVFTITQNYTDYSWPVSVAGTGTLESVYLDLMRYYDVRFYDLRTLKFSGFSGADDEFQFVLKDIVAVAYDPVSETEDGRFDVKVVFPRPGDDAVPVHSVAATFTADGSRAIQLPADGTCLFTEGGMESINTTPAMRNLTGWWHELENQEGIHCDGIASPTDNGQAAYDAAFVDADGNDMLGGSMVCGDVKETFDLEIGTHATNHTVLPCGVRVGRVYLAAGVVTDVQVRKHIRASLHGTVRQGSGRACAGQTVTLWEWDGQTWAQVGETTTDNWSRFRFATGGREWDCTLIAVLGDGPPTEYGSQGFNELRRWQSLVLVVPSGIDMKLSPFSGCVLVRHSDTLWSGGEAEDSYGNPREFSDALLMDRWVLQTEQSPEYTLEFAEYVRPTVFCDSTGQVLIACEDADSETPAVYVLGAYPTSQEATLMATVTGYAYPYLCKSETTGEPLLLARNASTGNMELLRYNPTESAWATLSVIGESDEAPAALCSLFGGTYVAAVTKAGIITVYRSSDDGLTWGEA